MRVMLEKSGVGSFRYGREVLIALLVSVELVGCLGIIQRVAYTEIDWRAYMSEVEGFLQGERNYENLQGDTGPLVYPAGFVYIFSALYKLTDSGLNVRTAQHIFAVVYLALLFIVLLVYRKNSVVPVWAWALLCLSKRIHSIFVLRMFNDCVAVLLGYLALLLFSQSRWRIGCLVYSGAVSVKMNMLLHAPGLLLLLLLGCGYRGAFICLVMCASVQLLLGIPFLVTYPVEYITRSFDLGRVFLFKWTVNFKFLSEEIFVSKFLSLALLLATICVWVLFAVKIVRSSWKGVKATHSKAFKLLGVESLVGIGSIAGGLNPEFVAYTYLASNFVGVCFARTLHYQFYCWYFHSLPLLLWNARLPTVVRVVIFAAIEYAFNVYPATALSSLVLQASHGLLLEPPRVLAESKCVVRNSGQSASGINQKMKAQIHPTFAVADQKLD